MLKLLNLHNFCQLFRHKSKGFSLIEVVLAIALLGIIAVGLLSALATASISIVIADERATAESLARSQMEYIKSQPYSDNGTYQKIAEADIPAGYDIEWPPTVVPLEEKLQKIAITVKHHDKPITTSANATLEEYKVDR